jgi:putative transposase
MCRLCGVSRSGYYAWKQRPPSFRIKDDARLTVTISAAYKRSRRTYGSPRIHRDLRASGFRVGKKRVERLMRHAGIVAKRAKRFRGTTDSNHPNPIAPNVLERRFSSSQPDTVWVTDVTFITTNQGWLYLAAIIDLCSRRVVGWATSDRNDRHLALQALHHAVANRKPRPGLIHHSDRGSPYASDDYRAAIKAYGIVPSMSRRGDCYDNAVAESFFSTLKREHVDGQSYVTHALATTSIGDYIERFYNLQRRHSAIDYLSPIEFELRLRSRREAA